MLESHVTHVLESLFNKVADLRWLLLNLTYKVALRQYPGLMKTKKKKKISEQFRVHIHFLMSGKYFEKRIETFWTKILPTTVYSTSRGNGCDFIENG